MARRGTAQRWALGGLVMMLAAGLAPHFGVDPAPAASAGSVETLGARLPSARESLAAAWDGSRAYLFGGYVGGGSPYTDQILRYDPADDAVTIAEARLPSGRAPRTAVWAAGAAYVFGGSWMHGSYDQVVRYDPSTDTATPMAAAIPFHRYAMSAVAAGEHVYLFGGINWGVNTPSDQVLRYDPAGDTFTAMQGTFPRAVWFTSATWDGAGATIYGGYENVPWLPHGSARIYRFDPAQDRVTELAARLPRSDFDGGAAATLGGSDFLFGRSWCTTCPGLTARYAPGWAAGTLSCHGLPEERFNFGFVSDGRAAFVFGGERADPWNRGRLDTIVRLEPQANCPPRAAIAPVAPVECLAGRGTATLDGSASGDPDGDALAFAWSAPGATLAAPAAARTEGSFPLGTTTATLEVSDGWATASAQAAVPVVDTVPPRTQAALAGTPGTHGWWRSPVDAALQPGDACGVARTLASLDGAAEQEGLAFRIAGEGPHSFRFRSVDLGGNAEAPQTLAVRIDTVPPTVAITTPAAGNAYQGETRLPLPRDALPETVVVGNKFVGAASEDATSGVDRVEFLVDGVVRATSAAPPYGFVWQASREGAGRHLLEARSVDRAGNVASASLAVLSVPTTAEGLRATGPPDPRLACPALPALCAALP